MHGAVKQHRHADVRLDDEDPDGDLDEDKVWTASRNDMVAIQLGAAGQPRRILDRLPYPGSGHISPEASSYPVSVCQSTSLRHSG